MSFDKTDLLAINTIRSLSIDAIEKANSGHPGLPMGAAPMAYVLWQKHLNFNPKNVDWFNRDRFVLSAGHGSMLIYSLLHLSGILEMDDLKEFRQYESKTPGHPEFKHTDGVEITTGPLGQGFAMSVGMAMAETHLNATFNTDDHKVVDHYTYVLASDGDLMEGISHEAASLAGHLGLGKLIVLYDSNDISLDGDLDKSFSEDVAGRFKAYNWHYLRVEDGNDLDAIDQAIEEAKQSDKPSLIEVKTVIGYGAPNKSGKSDAHGSPLGEAERQGAYEAYGLDHLKTFDVDDSVYERFNETLIARGESEETAWNEVLESFKTSNEAAYNDFTAAVQRELPKDYADKLPVYEAGTKKATRGNSGDMIQELSKAIPTFFGGAADLAGSNKTNVKEASDYGKDNYGGRNIWFGVREFAMAAAINGMAAHGGLYPYAGTFFVFSDYLKPAVRLSALMKLPVTYVFTHDSIAVGEDGPTHEPVEQLAGLRAIPNLNVIRPADGNETREAWKTALESVDTPTALVLTRQDLPVLDIDSEVVKEGVKRGGYIAYDGGSDAIVFATGSEVSLAVATAEKLAEDGVNIKVASIPNVQAFLNQDEAYIESVLNTDIDNRTAVEMAASLGWHRFVGIKGKLLTIDTFGASAPGGEVVERYGFTVENLSNIIRNK
ncbi:Transketolase [Jeotgalicoccus aerolatus]|uniref:Transketolase n=1 Tax=Jeotgalicoccus aerolatus TaxID=709510 RepID=A0A1G9D6I9_9STAP|nr:transketolase [Jeotgalicoccus aerolatus]MBP1951570.1 transketolase [Jeotgalicoccus aerolatus]NMA80518.1 transketolase [Jeotgalicoccus aerolatus]CAD2076092.1 Transketolase [Jeotgalicoccus aerolatus]SDK59334.1 transketolase [Jeotgalicoccus aerolatus]GGD96488.1 transketolase [Jeotgalicoccus aerolatus]